MSSPLPEEAPRENLLVALARLWFGFRKPVGRAAYAASGFGLAFVKYGLEAAIVYAQTGSVWEPLRYLSPVFTLREQGLRFASSGTLALLGAITLPFLWVGVSMSVRRAADAGISPWAGLGFLVPVLNYPFMLIFCALPSKPGVEVRWPAAGAYRSHLSSPPSAGPPSLVDRSLRSALLGVVAGVAIAGAMGVVSIYLLGKYGAALFFATPFLMGAVGAFLHNRPRPRPLIASIGVGVASVFIAGASMMLFALEGLLCLAMAFPIAAGLGVLGSLTGWLIAQSPVARPSHAGAAVLMLPALAGGESFAPAPRPVEVATAIEVDAAPAQVWPHVIGFSELDPPSELAFRLGIAHPVRARIEGEGVGAVRRCEFSTGPFVEPITRWEPPHRLSFDVASQPPPMHEWSPYRHVQPPHLDGYLRSRRGEFRLSELPGGRTRLEGSTWYEVEIFPQSYWQIWSDALLHRIHGRVLAHIKRLAEADVAKAAP
jgi:uncharacterized membrane protein YhaH (DUF805 family)